MRNSFSLSFEEKRNILIASLVTGAAISAFQGANQLFPMLKWTLTGFAPVIIRELGQRTVAEWIDAYVEVELSAEGSALTLVTGIFAYMTGMPFIALFPVTNSFSGKKYEHWGKSIDAIWMKRQFWIVLGGLVALGIGWISSLVLGFTHLAAAFLLFGFFQLMPFDYKNIPTGTLDGAYILRWSGLIWLVLMGISTTGLVFTL